MVFFITAMFRRGELLSFSVAALGEADARCDGDCFKALADPMCVCN